MGFAYLEKILHVSISISPLIKKYIFVILIFKYMMAIPTLSFKYHSLFKNKYMYLHMYALPMETRRWYQVS